MNDPLSRREFGQSAAMLAAAAALTGWSEPATALQTVAAPNGPMEHVHPDLREAAEVVLRFTRGAPPLSDATLASLRGPGPLTKPPLPDVPFEERTVEGGGGDRVKIYVINGRHGSKRGAILHTHGGGFVLGSARESVHDLQVLARTLDCVVVSVEYRLAPETRWSGSVEDNYGALRWLHGHAEEVGADPKRIALLGESAGGGHAALLALRALDRGEFPVAFQCLVYPMLDDRTVLREPPPHIGWLGWTPASNRYGWTSFLGVEPGSAAVPAAAVPARTSNLSGLPRTWIGVGAIDLFVDEGVTFAHRLIDAGVMTELVVVPGAFHGFDAMPGVLNKAIPIATRFRDGMLQALREGLST